MMRALYAGVSGLKGHQTRMDVIGNNISNVNTTGFKSSRVTFADMISQTSSAATAPNGTIGGTNAKQIGLGSSVASIDLLFTDGSVQSTGVNTDLALSGNGLFVVKNGNTSYYTRNGDFKFDQKYNYVMSGNGYKVQGWMAGSDGTVNTSSEVTDLTLTADQQSMPAKATSTITYSGNLNADVPTITAISGGTNQTTSASTTSPSVTSPVTKVASTTHPVTLTMSDGSTVTETTGAYTVGNSLPVTSVVSVYDDLGAKHNVTIYFTKTRTDSTNGNQWTASLDPDVSKSTADIKESDGSTTAVTMQSQKITFTTAGAYFEGGGTTELTLHNGASTPTGNGSTGTGKDQATVSFSGLTQYSGSSTEKADQNGYTAGTLKSVAFDNSGSIIGTYTNDQKLTLGKVAVAQFTNASGLEKQGSNLYSESNNSGTANIKTAADLGVTITPSALEMSNVDIADQFSDMIVTERGFQSNSKIITVSDEMLETLINMKR